MRPHVDEVFGRRIGNSRTFSLLWDIQTRLVVVFVLVLVLNASVNKATLWRWCNTVRCDLVVRLFCFCVCLSRCRNSFSCARLFRGLVKKTLDYNAMTFFRLDVVLPSHLVICSTTYVSKPLEPVDCLRLKSSRIVPVLHMMIYKCVSFSNLVLRNSPPQQLISLLRLSITGKNTSGYSQSTGLHSLAHFAYCFWDWLLSFALGCAQ